MAGIFGSFMRGFEGARSQRRQDEEDVYLRGERQYQAGRRGVMDEREDLGWTQGQEDRSRTLERDAQEYPIRFRSLVREDERGDIGLRADRFALDRQPVLARQADETHAENITSAKQMRSLRASQEGRASRAASIQNRLAEMQLSEAELAEQHRDFVRTIGAPARRFALTGDPAPLSQAWREVTDGDGELVQLEDGSYAAISPTTGEQKLGTRDEVLRALSMFATQPEAFLELRYQQAYGKNTSEQPAAVQEAEYVRGILPKEEGETDQAHALRAWMTSNLRQAKAPQEFYAETLKSLLENRDPMADAEKQKADFEDAKATADQLTEEYILRLSSGGGARGGLGSAMRQRDAGVDPQYENPQGDQPPSPGAVRAPDGYWYVRQGNGWARFD